MIEINVVKEYYDEERAEVVYEKLPQPVVVLRPDPKHPYEKHFAKLIAKELGAKFYVVRKEK